MESERSQSTSVLVSSRDTPHSILVAHAVNTFLAHGFVVGRSSTGLSCTWLQTGGGVLLCLLVGPW